MFIGMSVLTVGFYISSNLFFFSFFFYYLLVVVELRGQVCAISKMCVLDFVHVNLECCTIKLCSLSHSGTVCSVHFTPVCLQQHMDAADCYVLTVGVLKPFDKVGFFYVCVCVCVGFHTAVFIVVKKKRYRSSCQLLHSQYFSPQFSIKRILYFHVSIILLSFTPRFLSPCFTFSPCRFPKRLISNSL